jgi:hypothetical protein
MSPYYLPSSMYGNDWNRPGVDNAPSTPDAQPTAPVEGLSPSTGFDYSKALYGGASLASLYGDFSGMASQKLNLPQSAPVSQGQGQPSYSGAAMNAASNARPQGADAGEIGSSAIKGAAAGSVLGVPGAIVGGLIGGLGAGISGLIRGNEQDTEKNRAMESQHAYQHSFNDASAAFQQRQDSMNDYRQRNSSTRRYANLYRPPSQYV